MERAYGPLANRAAPLYDSAASDPVLGDAGATLATDTAFRCPTVMTQTFRAAAGDAVFAYQFEQSLPGKEAQGAGHTFELPYVFGNLSPTGFMGGNFGPADRELSAQMQAYWTNFVKNGDPNGPGMPDWKPFRPDETNYMVFADGRTGLHQNLRAAACSLYREHWTAVHHAG